MWDRIWRARARVRSKSTGWRSGAGFGLRHQAVAAKADGAPIDYVDRSRGNFSLTESVAVVDKKNATTDLAMKMAETIVKDARKDLIVNYPVALYEGETVDEVNKPAYSMTFEKPLTVERWKSISNSSTDPKNKPA